MRGIYSSVTDIRRQVFTEVARMAYEGGDYSRVEELPYKILPGEVSKYRDSIFLERAIVGERLRLSMGLPLRPIDEHAPLSTGIEEAARPEKYYEPPLINIIKFACNACPEKSFHVTDMCQGCLAHPCVEVCPKGAVSIVHGKSVIDQSKCVKCGQCANVCPYGAIHKMERPCAKACTYHQQLIQNMLTLISEKAVDLSERVEVLSQRTIREKLICFFLQMAGRQKSESFTLPFTIVDLSDYLSIDRSAMTRELKRMKEEGLIEINRRNIRLHIEAAV